jgi:hypothetical protein
MLKFLQNLLRSKNLEIGDVVSVHGYVKLKGIVKYQTVLKDIFHVEITTAPDEKLIGQHFWLHKSQIQKTKYHA